MPYFRKLQAHIREGILKSFADHLHNRHSGQHLPLWAISCLFFLAAPSAWPAPGNADNTPQPPKKLVLSLDTAEALIRIIRESATPEYAASLPKESSPLIDEPLSLPLIVTLYHNGHPKWQHACAKTTFRSSAEEAGQRLADSLAKLPLETDLRAKGVLQIDLVMKIEPLPDALPHMLPRYITPGFTGLRYATKNQVVYFSPLAVFRQWHKPDIAKAIFQAQESREPFLDFLADCIQATSFVEAQPGRMVMQIYRGNVLHLQPTPDKMLRVLSHAGIRLVKMQREDGSFPADVHPMGVNTAEDVADAKETEDLEAHLRAAITLILLYQSTGEKSLDHAADRALQYVFTSLRNDPKRKILYIPTQKKSVETSALLLTALCLRALEDPNPTADGRMEYLGNFLCLMTKRDGRLSSRLPTSGGDKPPYVVLGGPYAEALMALSLLQQISPSRTTRRAADRIAALVSAGGSAPPYPVPRTVEALAVYYNIRPSSRQAEIILSFADKLAQRQVKTSPYADYLGGFGKPDLSPDTLTTAQTMGALSAAYRIAQATGHPTETYSETILQGALFLVNSQFRHENSFFLPLRDWIEGGFRVSPENLEVRLLENAEAIRALMQAASITALTVPPETFNRLQNNGLK